MAASGKRLAALRHTNLLGTQGLEADEIALILELGGIVPAGASVGSPRAVSSCACRSVASLSVAAVTSACV